MGVKFIRAGVPLNLENAVGPIPGYAGRRTPDHAISTMETLGGVFRSKEACKQPYITCAPEDPFSDFFTPPVQNEKPPPLKPSKLPKSGRIPLGRGLPPGTFRKWSVSTQEIVFTKLGIGPGSDGELINHAMEIHAACLSFASQVLADMKFLKNDSLKKGGISLPLLEALERDAKKIFMLTPDDYQFMRSLFRALALKYHPESNHPGATRNKGVFIKIQSDWGLIKDFYGWA